MTSDREKKKQTFSDVSIIISKALWCACPFRGQTKKGVALSRCRLLTAWHFKKHERLLIAAGGGQASTSRRVRSHSRLNGRLCNSTPRACRCLTVSREAKNKHSYQSKRPVGLNTRNLKQNKPGFHLLISLLGDRLNSPREKGESRSENTQSVNIS